MSASRSALRTIIARHKLASAAGVAVLFVLVAVMAATALSSSKGVALSDSTSCSQWSSATQAQRDAYASLYVTEHGALASGASDAGSIESAINQACTHAAYLAESDEVTVVAAIKHEF